MSKWFRNVAGLVALPAFLALSWPYIITNPTAVNALQLHQVITDIQTYLFPSTTTIEDLTSSLPSFTCTPHNYTTQIISIDPLVIYITSFLGPHEIPHLLEAGEKVFKPSTVTKGGRIAPDPDRTSHTAFLPKDEAVVQCVLERARLFTGTLVDDVKGSTGGKGSVGEGHVVKEQDEREIMGRPQLVRYTTGQKFNLHYDWYKQPQKTKMAAGKTHRWNRIASFFAILEDDCEEGETWFPHVNVSAPSLPISKTGMEDEEATSRKQWRSHEDGGVAFAPVKGNAIFWVNLDRKSGKGDERVRHAGLPVKGGRKTAMNIWPRMYFD